MRWRHLLGLLAALSLLSAGAAAQAVPVTIDFTSGGGDNTNYYEEDGFRVRPEAGDHFENNFPGYLGWFSWHDGDANTPPNILTVDRADGTNSPFSALSVQIKYLSTAQGSTGGILFRDSHGHAVTSNSVGTVTLNFTNTTFLAFQTVNSGVNSFPVSIDNLVLDTQPSAVPEPATMLLLGAGVATVAAGRLRRRRSRR